MIVEDCQLCLARGTSRSATGISNRDGHRHGGPVMATGESPTVGYRRWSGLGWPRRFAALKSYGLAAGSFSDADVPRVRQRAPEWRLSPHAPALAARGAALKPMAA
jgi:hypothetical protein